jgi:hypothetical protein
MRRAKRLDVPSRRGERALTLIGATTGYNHFARRNTQYRTQQMPPVTPIMAG